MEKKRLNSIEDLAKLAGVAKSTVSRALNDSPLVNSATKEKILSIALEYNFRPSAIARNLSMRSSKTIAFVTHAYRTKGECCVSDPFSLEIMGGIAMGLHDLGYDLLVVHIDPDKTEWARQYLDSGKVDGFILMTSNKKRKHVEELKSINAPFIVWGPGVGNYCSVCGDDRRGGRLATERLISLGRKRIGFIGGPRIETEVQQRFEGYREALALARIEANPRWIAYGDYTEAGGARALEEILDSDKSIDAIFVGSDLMAIAALRVLHRRGLNVPEDVAVVGYDNLSIASYATPSLTTISQNIPLAGKLLARDLVSYIEKGIVTTSSVPVELIIRQSA